MAMSIELRGTMEQAGAIANRYAVQNIIARYRSEQSANTLKAQDQDLASYAAYLGHAGITVGDLLNAESWIGTSWGLVDGFREWMTRQGLAISTINRRLSTVKVYAKMAAQAGAIDDTEIRMLDAVRGYSRTAGKRIDGERPVTRRSNKKSHPVRFSNEQVEEMIASTQDGTSQGRRDRVLLCMLFHQGLRAGELAGMLADNVDMQIRQMTFYRSKVDLEQTHDLHSATYDALIDYMVEGDCKATGPLLRGSRKGGYLTEQGMSEINITKRVGAIAKRIGIDAASAHDCRHWWATYHARRGTDVLQLQEAGGWSSLAMPRRYVDRARIANKGMVDK